MRVFCCSCYPYPRPYNNHKLAFKSGKYVFLGYNSLHEGYKCFHSYYFFMRLPFFFIYELIFLQFVVPSSICGSYLFKDCDTSVNPSVNFFQTYTTAQIDASFYQSPTPAIDLDSIPYS